MNELTGGCIVQWLTKLFEFMKCVSLLEWVRCMSSRVQNSKSATEIYVLCWLVVEILFLGILFGFPTMNSTVGLFVPATLFLTWRLIDLLQVAFNTLIFDRIRCIQRGQSYERNPERWLLLNLFNYAELIIIFGVLGFFARDAFKPIFETMWQGFYYSVSVATMLGSNSIPLKWQGNLLFLTEIAFALIFIILILGNAVSQLGWTRDKDENLDKNREQRGKSSRTMCGAKTLLIRVSKRLKKK